MTADGTDEECLRPAAMRGNKKGAAKLDRLGDQSS